MFFEWHRRFGLSDRARNEDVAQLIDFLAGAFRLGLYLCAAVFVFWLDTVCPWHFTEYSPTELAQTAALFLAVLNFSRNAVETPECRRALVLVSGFFACMLIREQDWYLDFLAHGSWKWLALAVASGCIIHALGKPGEALSGLARICRHRAFLCLVAGTLIVLVYSRLMGMKVVLAHLFVSDGLVNEEFVRHCAWIGKTSIEESTELVGYLIIAFASRSMRDGGLKGKRQGA